MRPGADVRHAALVLALILATGVARAEDAVSPISGVEEQDGENAAAPLRAIVFAGNNTTRERVMRHELPFEVGETVTPETLQKGRQAIQDLGLFNRVTMSTSRDAEGYRVRYEVVEKFYLLAYPRVDANADGDYAYGAQLRFNNLFGLNHTLRATILQSRTAQNTVGSQREYSMSYFAPLVFDSQWSLGGSAGFVKRPVISSAQQLDEEQFQTAQFIASRALGEGTATRGWMIGAGLLSQNEKTASHVDEYGAALAPVGVLGYRDIRLKIYSEEGTAFGLRVEGAEKGVASDYDYAKFTASGIRYLPLGTTPHQTLHLIGEMGVVWDGPPRVNNFLLGGSNNLRGYDRNLITGNAYYRVATEWARPLFRPWLRTVVIAEAGNAYARPNEIDLGRVKASVGFGLRLRVTTFVDLEIEAGIAVPVDGGSARFFAGKV